MFSISQTYVYQPSLKQSRKSSSTDTPRSENEYNERRTASTYDYIDTEAKVCYNVTFLF